MTRRQARAIERSAVAEARRSHRAVAVADRRRSHSAPSGWSAKRMTAAVFGGIAAVGFLAASIAPVVGTQIAQASQDPSLSAYASAADEAQLFAASEKGGTLAALSTVSYEAELRTPTPTPTPEPEPAPAGVPETPTDDGGGEQALPAPYQPPAPYAGGGEPADWMAAAGIAESDWGYVDYIVSHESGWNPNATNPSSGACGLVQALPCSKVPGNGYDPVDNLRWGSGYAIGRYGSWANAYAFWTSNHWW
ncbi:transglycosylase SLT domain-containing protein [Microbacterium karelineae]|uniref:aggregation-promoting factor C-terminal-like domain-containing protein n=1 Tax=Microbacterium karelineae TaxID=2654283 RepID=UPI001E3C1DAB|nr:transglycosylase SLT domain-containing protein [Microbacterium karelineae]